MKTSFGLPRGAELWDPLPGPHLQATAGPWECPAHLSQPGPTLPQGPLPIFSTWEPAQPPAPLLRLSFPSTQPQS